MGKVIVDVHMLGLNFMQVIFREAMSIAKENNLDADKIGKELGEAPTQQDFAEIIEKYFKDELVIYW